MAQKGCDDAAKELTNVQVEFRIARGSSLTEQSRIVDELLSDHVSGIAISPWNTRLESAMLNKAGTRGGGHPGQRCPLYQPRDVYRDR
jgi:ABC-type sugar transport system substrate-binding protein